MNTRRAISAARAPSFCQRLDCVFVIPRSTSFGVSSRGYVTRPRGPSFSPPPSADVRRPLTSRAMVDAMDRVIVARRLERAEQRRAERARLIAQQIELIAKMSALGLDATPYRNMLARLEQTQGPLVEDMSTAKRDADSAAQN